MSLNPVPLEQLSALVEEVNGAVSGTMDIFSTYVLALLGGAGLFPEEVVRNLGAELQLQVQRLSETYRQQLDGRMESLYGAILASCQDLSGRATLSVTRQDLLASIEAIEQQSGSREALEEECANLRDQLAELSSLSHTVEELRTRVADLGTNPAIQKCTSEKLELEKELEVLTRAIQAASSGSHVMLPEAELLRKQIEETRKAMSADSLALVQDYLDAEHELNLYSLIEHPVRNGPAPSEDTGEDLSQLSHQISALQATIELKRAKHQTAAVYIDKIMELKAEKSLLDNYIINPASLTDNISMLQQSIDSILESNPAVMRGYTERKQLLSNIEELRQMVQFPTNGLNENALLRKQYQEMAANHPDVAETLKKAEDLRSMIQRISTSTLETALFECTSLKQKLTELEKNNPEISLLVREHVECRSIVDLYQQALDNNAGFADKLNQEKETLGMLETSSPDVKLLVDIYKRTHDEILEFKEYINNKQSLEQELEVLRGELTMLVEGNPDIVGLLADKNKLAQDIKNFGDSLANIKTIYNEVEAMRGLKEELKRNNPEVEKLTKQRAALQDEIMELNGLATSSTALATEICNLEQELNDLRTNSPGVVELLEKRGIIQNEIKSLKLYAESPSTLLGELVKSQEELASIKESSAEILSMITGLEKIREEQTAVETAVRNKLTIEADYIQLQENLAALKETHGNTLRLLDENNALRTQIMDIKEGNIDPEALQEDNYKLQENLAALQLDFPDIESIIQDKLCLLQQINEFHASIDDRGRLEESKQVLLDKIAELKTLNPDIDSLLAENERLKEKMQALEISIQSRPRLEQQNRELINALEDLKRGSPDVLQLLQSIEGMQQEVSQYKNYINNPDQLAQKEVEIEHEIAELHSTYSHVFERLAEIDSLQQKLETSTQLAKDNSVKSECLVEQIAQLKAQLKALDDTAKKSPVDALLAEKAQLEREIVELQRYSLDTIELRNVIASLSNEARVLRNTNSAVSLLLDEQDRLRGLINAFKSGEINEKTLSDDISQLQTELFTIKSEKGITHLVNEVEHLKLILEEMKTYKDNPSRLEARQRSLETEVETLRKSNPQLAELINRIEVTTAELNSLTNAIKQPSAIVRENANLVDQLSVLKQKHPSIFSIIEENKYLETLVGDIHEGRLNTELLETKKSDLQLRFDALMKANPQLHQLIKDCDELGISLKQYERIEDPKVVLDQLEAKKARLQLQLQQLQQDDHAITALNQDIKDLHAEIDNYLRPGALDELETRREVIQNNLLELRESYPEIHNCLLDIEDLTILCEDCRMAAESAEGTERNTKALQTRIDNLHNILEAFKSSNYNLSTMIDKALSLRKELKEFKSQIGQESRLQNEIETLEVQLATARDSNTSLSARIKHRAELSQDLQEFRDFSTNPTLLDRQIASLSSSLEEARQANPEVAAAVLERQYLEDQLAQFLGHKDDPCLIEEVTILKRKLASLKKTYVDITSLIEERDALRALIQEIEVTADNPEGIEREHSMLYSKFSSLITSTKEFLLLKAENDALKKDILALNKQMSAMDDIIAENVRYEQEINDLRNQAENMTTRLSKSMLDASQTMSTLSQQKTIVMTELERQKELMDKLMLVDLPKAAEALNYRAPSSGAGTGAGTALTPSRRSTYGKI